MSVICGLPVAPSDVETTLRYIEDVLVSAGEYGGKAFGQFPRNAIVARMKDPSADVCFSNLDVWFTSEEGFREFLDAMENKCHNPKLFIFSRAPYTFGQILPMYDVVLDRYGSSSWKQYKLSWAGSNIVRVNIIISEEFPVDDFNVNCLTYQCRKDYSTGKKIITRELKAEKGYQKDELIMAINNKRATMLNSYVEKVIKDKDIDRADRLLLVGWTVTFGAIQIDYPVSPDKLPKLLLALERSLDVIRIPVNSQTSTSPSLTVETQESKGLTITPEVITPMPVSRESSDTPLRVGKLLYHIDNILFIAGEYGGKAFGDFVTNAVVPRLQDRWLNVLVYNVDLWFITEKSATQFIDYVRNTTFHPELNYNFTECSGVEKYGCYGTEYNLSTCGTNIAWFNIFIGEEFPVADFDIDCLTYSCRKEYTTGKEVIIRELKGERGYQKDQLIKAILHKEARLFVGYGEKAVKDQAYFTGIMRLITLGWVIYLGESKVTITTTQGKLEDILTAKALKDIEVTPTSSLDSKNAAFSTEPTSDLSLEDTLEDLVRNNSLVKGAIARLITKMICESVNVVASRIQEK